MSPADEGEEPDKGGHDQIDVPSLDALNEIDDVARLIDANLAKHDPSWIDAVRTRATFRTPGLQARYAEIERAFTAKNKDDIFADKFRARCVQVNKTLGDRLGRPFEDAFSLAQIRNALRDVTLRLDKAVTLALAINEFARQLNFADDALVSINGSQYPLRYRWHSLAAQIFSFVDLNDFISRAEEHLRRELNNPHLDAITDLAGALNQSPAVIRSLAQPTTKPNSSTLASYRLQRAIFKILQRVPPLSGILTEAKTVRLAIVRQQKAGDPSRKTVSGENIEATEKITREPYDWPKAEEEALYPPEPDFAPPAHWEPALNPAPAKPADP